MGIKRWISLLLLALVLYGCGSAGEGGAGGAGGGAGGGGGGAGGVKPPAANRNPKDAAVKIENGVVTITMPAKTSSFWFEKVKDDSVPFTKLYFRHDSADGKYYYQTNLETWKPLELTDNVVSMGAIKLTFAEAGITATYPSGTWRFP